MAGKRRINPETEKRSVLLRRLGYLAPRLWDREEADKEHSLATEQWAEMLRLHIPGLCISDMPRMFELPATMPDGENGFTWSSLNDLEFDQSRWNEIPAHLKEAIEGWGNATTEILEGWTYKSVLPPNAAPRTHDEPNPRVYMLNGKMVRSGWKGDDLRKRVCALFEIRLLDLFRLSPNNVRKQNVADRLQHHWEHGGNADAFLDYTEGVCDKWEGEAPTYFDMPRMQRLQVEDAAILMRTMRKWVEEKRKASTAMAKGAKAKQREKDEPKPLKERFPKPEQYARFIELLQEHEIVDSGGAFVPGHDHKSRLLGAYEGASENPSLRFSTGSDAEIVATLNNAFPTLRLSSARPQDLRGTGGNVELRLAFKTAVFPR